MLRQERSERANRELRADVTWAEVHDPSNGFAGRDRQRSKIAVVGKDNALLRDTPSNKGQIVRAVESFLFHIHDIMPRGA